MGFSKMSNGSLAGLTSLNVNPIVHVHNKSESRNYGLATPVAVFWGGNSTFSLIANTTLPQPVERAEEVASVQKACAGSSAYQPVLVVLDYDSKIDVEAQDILAKLELHLFARIVLLISKHVAERDTLTFLNSPFRNPCLPIRVCHMPKDERQLEWELIEFFEQAEQFAEAIGKLMRFNSLSVRESRVANYITKGLPNKRICKLLGVSEKTIEKCRKETYAKLGVNSGPELASLVTFRNHFRWPASVAFPSR